MQKHRLLTLSLLFLVAALVGAACARAATPTPTATPTPRPAPAVATPTATPTPAAIPTPTPTAPPARGGKLTVALITFDVEQLVPHLSGNLSGVPLVFNFADFLIGLTPDNEFTNAWGLSDSWKMIDGKTFELNLRKGAKFHDGTEFTAEDAKFSLEQLATPDASASRCVNCAVWNKNLDRVEVLDPYKIRIYLKKNDPFLLNILTPQGGADAHIYSKKAWERAGGTPAGWETRPVGTGPWVFKERKQGSFSRFTRWADYYAPAFAARFNELEFLLTAEDSSRLAQVKTGRVQLAVMSGPLAAEIQKAGLGIMGPRIVDNIYLNFYQSRDQGHCTNKLEVRKAINLSIDRSAVLKALYPVPGTGEPVAVTLTSPWVEGWDPTLKPYPYNPEEARRLLKAAGCDGMDMTLYQFSFPIAPEMKDLQEVASGYYAAVGVKPKLIPIDYTALAPLLRGDKLGPDQVKNPSGVHTIPAARNLGEMLRVHGLPPSEGGSVGGLPDLKYVQLKNQYAEEMDPSKRQALAKTIVRLMYDEYVNIPIAARNAVYAVDTKIVCGWAPLHGTQVGLMLNTVVPCPGAR